MDLSIRQKIIPFEKTRFWGLFSVTSAMDERGTGQGWPSERKTAPKTL